MAATTKIEWSDATNTPIRARRRDTGKVGWHCERVSPACQFCYAAAHNGRSLPGCGTGLDYVRSSRDKVEMFIDEPTLLQPLKWKRPRRIFSHSMTDLFGEFVPFDLVDSVVAVMAICRRHTFQVLTKRPERMAEYFSDRDLYQRIHAAVTWIMGYDNRERPAINRCDFPLPNVWLGTTVENQEWADKRREHLKACPAAAVRFVSYEPALGPVDWAGWEFVDWIISGGESGRNARPAHPDWFRATRDFCRDHGIAYFHKQWGEWCPFGQLPESSLRHSALGDHRLDDKRYCRIEGKYSLHRVGKKAAGRLLDGKEWSEFPAPVAAE